MSHKTCFAACAIVCLTVFTLVGCSGVDPYRSVEAGHVVADPLAAGHVLADPNAAGHVLANPQAPEPVVADPLAAGHVVADPLAPGPVVAGTGTLIGDLFFVIAILAGLVLIAVSLMVRFVKGKSATADSGFAEPVGELPRKSPKKLVLKPDDF
jgi:hypothetical protein